MFSCVMRSLCLFVFDTATFQPRRSSLSTALHRISQTACRMLRRSPSVITISEHDVAELQALLEDRRIAKKTEEVDKSKTASAPGPSPQTAVAASNINPTASTQN